MFNAGMFNAGMFDGGLPNGGLPDAGVLDGGLPDGHGLWLNFGHNRGGRYFMLAFVVNVFVVVGIDVTVLIIPRAVEAKVLPHQNRDVLVDRAGMRLLFLDAQPRQEIKYLTWLDLELPSQLINADFLHI